MWSTRFCFLLFRDIQKRRYIDVHNTGHKLRKTLEQTAALGLKDTEKYPHSFLCVAFVHFGGVG